jgi:hypothetical protein
MLHLLTDYHWDIFQGFNPGPSRLGLAGALEPVVIGTSIARVLFLRDSCICLVGRKEP